MKPRTVTCVYCGGAFPLTHKGRPKQHRNGAETCHGSGQLAAWHEARRELIRQCTPEDKRATIDKLLKGPAHG